MICACILHFNFPVPAVFCGNVCVRRQGEINCTRACLAAMEHLLTRPSKPSSLLQKHVLRPSRFSGKASQESTLSRRIVSYREYFHASNVRREHHKTVTSHNRHYFFSLYKIEGTRRETLPTSQCGILQSCISELVPIHIEILPHSPAGMCKFILFGNLGPNLDAMN